MSRLINRDPFAREELHRMRLFVSGTTCNWCGSVKRTRKGDAYLFVYETQTDGGRSHVHKGSFCCKSCHDAYHMA